MPLRALPGVLLKRGAGEGVWRYQKRAEKRREEKRRKEKRKEVMRSRKKKVLKKRCSSRYPNPAEHLILVNPSLCHSIPSSLSAPAGEKKIRKRGKGKRGNINDTSPSPTCDISDLAALWWCRCASSISNTGTTHLQTTLKKEEEKGKE